MFKIMVISYLLGLVVGTIIALIIASYRMSDKTVFGKFFITHTDGIDTYNVALEDIDAIYASKRIILEIEDINNEPQK